MARMINSYNQSYRGAGRSKTIKTTSVEPGMEIVLSKQEVIYTDPDEKHVLVIRIQTNNRVYWMYNNEILETNSLCLNIPINKWQNHPYYRCKNNKKFGKRQYFFVTLEEYREKQLNKILCN